MYDAHKQKVCFNKQKNTIDVKDKYKMSFSLSWGTQLLVFKGCHKPFLDSIPYGRIFLDVHLNVFNSRRRLFARQLRTTHAGSSSSNKTGDRSGRLIKEISTDRRVCLSVVGLTHMCARTHAHTRTHRKRKKG